VDEPVDKTSDDEMNDEIVDEVLDLDSGLDCGSGAMRKLLIVEDEKLFAQLLSDAFSDIEGTEVDMAGNGKEALEMLSKKTYDLVLTDIHMPEMNGRELLKSIRSKDNDVGIIILTAFPEVDYIKEFNDLGIEDFLSKAECDLKSLQELVSEYFRRKEIEFLSESF